MDISEQNSSVSKLSTLQINRILLSTTKLIYANCDFETMYFDGKV